MKFCHNFSFAIHITDDFYDDYFDEYHGECKKLILKLFKQTLKENYERLMKRAVWCLN